MLFAGASHNSGENNCFYCGAYCDNRHKTKDYVRDTFTNHDIIKYPNSEFVCQGCVMSLGSGFEDLDMLDGTVKTFNALTPLAFAPRKYSWLLTSHKRIAFTKAHIANIREILIDKDKLPEPPFAIILSDSGQKQLIFRAPVGLSKDAFPVMLEDRVVDITPESLKERLEIASQISTKIGKPTLNCGFTVNTYIAARKVGIDACLTVWRKVKHEPLSKIAAWIAPAKGS